MSTTDKPARQRPPAPGAVLLSLDQAAALLGLSRRSLERMSQAGTLTTRRIGRRVLVPRAEVDRLANEASPPAA